MAGKKFKQRKTDVIQDGIVYRMYKETYSVYTYTEDLPERVVVADKIGDIPVTVLDTKCFWHSECREVILPETIEVIKAEAFKLCVHLEEISIPSTVKEVQTGAFRRCDKLKQTLFHYGLYIGNSENPYLILRTNIRVGHGDLVVQVHPKTKFVMDTAFSVCRDNHSTGLAYFENTKQLTLHDNLVYIDSNAFEGGVPFICIDSIEWLCKYGKKLPGYYHRRLTVGGKETDGTIVIPASVTDIPEGCFSGYDFVHVLKFEGDISTIGSYAFANCKNLKEIHFPQKVGTIGESAFAKCPNLNNVDFHEIEKIGQHAFGLGELKEIGYRPAWWEKPKIAPSTAGLHTITFHKRIGKICDQAFKDNMHLQSLTGLENVEKLEGDPFAGTPCALFKDACKIDLPFNPEITVTFTDETDGSDIEFSVTLVFRVRGKEYAAIKPFGEEEGPTYLLRIENYNDGEWGDWVLENIEDDAELDAVADAYDALVDEEQ